MAGCTHMGYKHHVLSAVRVSSVSQETRWSADIDVVATADWFEVSQIASNQSVYAAGHGNFQKRQIGRIGKDNANLVDADVFSGKVKELH